MLNANIAGISGINITRPAIENQISMRNMKQDKLKEAAENFEAFFVGFLLNTADKTIERENYLYSGFAEDTFRQMLYEALSQDVVKTGKSDFGIAKMIMEYFKE